jgi:hypothetical protein
MEQPSYFAILPADVRYSKSINANEKLLYAEITCLCNSKGFCWATNKYFAELYNCTPQAISKWIANLEKYNFITKTYIYKENTKEILNRNIRLVGINNDLGGINSSLGGYQHTIKDNNNNNNKYIYSETQKNSEIDPQRAIDIIQANIQASKDNEYSYTDFLNDFNKYREQKANIKHPIETLTSYEKMLFNQNNKDKEYYKYALAGLFYQDKIIQSCITRPKHLLENIEKYHDAGKNKIQLYQTKEK